LRRATSTLEGEEVKNQIKQVLEKVEDIWKRQEQKSMVSQNSIRRFLPSPPHERGQKWVD
jgi:hypothetical protein